LQIANFKLPGVAGSAYFAASPGEICHLKDETLEEAETTGEDRSPDGGVITSRRIPASHFGRVVDTRQQFAI
jgi:hypothetical protein